VSTILKTVSSPPQDKLATNIHTPHYWGSTSPTAPVSL